MTLRVAVVDIGTNSTRLLVADVGNGTLTEVERRSTVTRLGEGVEATGLLGAEPQGRVFRTLDQYAERIAALGCRASAALMTSAVRDSANGAAFADRVRDVYGLAGRTLSGDEEARLTFLGATAARSRDDQRQLVVVDIGGGSTELVTGVGGYVGFHVSTQVGVVRHTERHIQSDPPERDELLALAADARATFEAEVPADVREATSAAVAVAGTATSAAAIDLELVPYDTTRVEGHRLSTRRLRDMLERLAGIPLVRRRETPGLHPDRAPTIVAGLVILLEALALFEIAEVEISDRDILWGMALELGRTGATG